MSAARRLALALVALAGCAHTRGLPVATVRSGAQCGGTAEGVSARWLGTEAALREALAAERRLGAETPVPAVDFAREGVLLVSMGQRPTAGYSIALADPQAKVERGVATIAVRFEEPPPDAILAQVVTSPCLLLALPREGLREVRIVDGSAGAVRASARVAP